MRIASLVPSLRSPLLAGLVVGAVGLLFSQPAAAIPDTTLVIPYSGANPTGGGPTDVIGANFDTTLLTATRTATVSSVNLQLIFHTQYDNISTSARYADVFFRIPGGPGNSFTIGAALGYQPAIAGVTGNLLSGITYQTSIDIWAGAGGSTYGGKFIDLDASQKLSPVRVLTGLDIGDVTVSRTGPSGGYYDITVNISSTNAAFITATGNANPFDVFWGTGDCSNDAILATLVFPNQAIPTPEPASLAVLGVALLGLGMTTRRRRA